MSAQRDAFDLDLFDQEEPPAKPAGGVFRYPDHGTMRRRDDWPENFAAHGFTGCLYVGRGLDPSAADVEAMADAVAAMLRGEVRRWHVTWNHGCSGRCEDFPAAWDELKILTELLPALGAPIILSPDTHPPGSFGWFGPRYLPGAPTLWIYTRPEAPHGEER